MVCWAFLGERPVGLQINHKDCNKKNNHIENLEYINQIQNMRHAVNNGLRDFSKKTRRLTINQAEEIKQKYSSGKYFAKELSAEYKINCSSIWKIIKGKTYVI